MHLTEWPQHMTNCDRAHENGPVEAGGPLIRAGVRNADIVEM